MMIRSRSSQLKPRLGRVETRGDRAATAAMHLTDANERADEAERDTSSSIEDAG